MDCQEFLALHTEYLDERLDASDAARCRRHLERCGSCRRYDRVLRRGGDLLRSLPEIEPSADILARIQYRIRHADRSGGDERAGGAAAVVSLAIAASLAIVAWSPLLRDAAPDAAAVDAAAIGHRAVAPAARVGPRSSSSVAAPVNLLAEWPDLGWWSPAPGREPDTGPSFVPIGHEHPGPYLPLIVDPPAVRPAGASWYPAPSPAAPLD